MFETVIQQRFLSDVMSCPGFDAHVENRIRKKLIRCEGMEVSNITDWFLQK